MLTSSQIAKSATEILEDQGFNQRRTPKAWEDKEAYIYEDKYAIVGLVVYENCDELVMSWHEDQIVLSEVITERIGRGEPKASEGYLALLTDGLRDMEKTRALTSIRYNTNHLRKLVATGDELQTPSDVRQALQPLLPIDLSNHAQGGQAMGLEELPQLIDREKIPNAEAAAKTLISAYKDQDSLLEALHQIVQNR